MTITDLDHALDAATRWYGRHQAHYLYRDRMRMVDTCAQHLMEQMQLPARQAQRAAQLALADIEAGQVRGFIDIDRSTSHMLVLHDVRTGDAHMLTLPELFALVHARGGPPAAPARGNSC